MHGNVYIRLWRARLTVKRGLDPIRRRLSGTGGPGPRRARAPERAAETTRDGVCPVPFREMVINCDGSVPCGTTVAAPILGQFGPGPRPPSMREMWNGPGACAMRLQLLRGDRSSCGHCPLAGCSAYRALSTREQVHALDSHGAVEGLPEQLLIEPVVTCNLDCPTLCGRSYPKRMRCTSRRSVPAMPPALFQDIVDRIDGVIPRIGLYNYGEPLLHPGFPAMCRWLRSRCPESFIFTSTNGVRLSVARLRVELLESCLDEIIVSVDGASQPTYAAYRRGGDLASVLEGMACLRRERDRAGMHRPRIVWRYILFAWNDSDAELARAESLAREIGVDRFCYLLCSIPFLASRRFQPGLPAFDRVRPLMY